MLPGDASRWKMALSTSCSLEPRAPSTASKPELVAANTACDCVFTTHTVSSSPAASAMLPAVTSVESACCRSERWIRLKSMGILQENAEVAEEIGLTLRPAGCFFFCYLCGLL